ncbi:MAG: TonB-dependent receptor [Tannerellaceae bacterium]|jgi:TonB-linked SusC/RagA family outer membrane protein|nr:TonB-dependent receptor [Tannerellaceae bacterium]
MKLLLKIVLIAGLFYTPFAYAESYMQVAMISLDLKNATIEEAFKAIEEQTEFTFFYDENELDSGKRIDLKVDNAKITFVLDRILDKNVLSYKITDRHIVLYKPRPEREKKQSDAKTISQQEIVVKGTVIDENNEPIIGASVVEKGTTNGIMTDIDGRFSLKVKAGAVLQVSFVGYNMQEVAAGNASDLRIVMKENSTLLEEVVVVAYGKQKKVSITGSIASIQTQELKQSPSANLSASLAGRLPGLTSMQISGRPGADNVNLHLRGKGTTNGSDPLIMIDGVPRSNISTLDPNEIASISILKDASATAVFGVRGANGVILITTRRGEVGKAELNVSLDYSGQSFTVIPRHLHSYTYAELQNEAAANSGRSLPFTPYMINKYKDGSDPVFYPDRDLFKEYYNELSPQTRINANMNGGIEKLKYFINIGYIGQGSNLKTQKNTDLGYDPAFKMNRYNFRGNLDFEAAKNLKVSLNLASYLQKANSPNANTLFYDDVDYLVSDVLTHMMGANPTEPGPLTAEGYTTPDGTPVLPGMVVGQGPEQGRSIFGELNRMGYRSESNAVLNSSLVVDWGLDFVTKGLSAKAMVSYDSDARTITDGAVIPRIYYYQAGREEGESSYYTDITGESAQDQIKLYKGMKASYYTNMQFSLNYARAFDKHDITGMVLMQRDNWDVVDANLPYNILGMSGRFTYGYDSRYFAEVNLGYNGSEQFAPKNRFGFFPAFSAGWVVSNEKFLKDNPVLTNLKLRASYGEVGNDKLGEARFLYLSSNTETGETDQIKLVTPSLGRQKVIVQGLVGNDALQWEVAKKQNYGVDLQFLGVLSLGCDIFFEKRSDILINRGTVPELQGVKLGNLPKVNMGIVENRGFELEASYMKVFNKDFSVNLRGNYAFNRNEAIFMDEATLSEDYYYRTRTTGFRLEQPFGYEIDRSNGSGYISTQEELDNLPEYRVVSGAPRLGDFVYKDLNEDGIVDEKDQVPIGYSNVPEISYGFSASINWKQFDFSFLFSGIANVSMSYPGFRYNEEMAQHGWTQERYNTGGQIDYPALAPGNQSSSYIGNSFFILNRSFLRLKTTEIGYTFPKEIFKSTGINKVRIYASGNNLLTFTKMKTKYLDPEQESGGAFPLTKMVNIGINVTF